MARGRRRLASIRRVDENVYEIVLDGDDEPRFRFRVDASEDGIGELSWDEAFDRYIGGDMSSWTAVLEATLAFHRAQAIELP